MDLYKHDQRGFKLENGFYPSPGQSLQALVVKTTVGRIPDRYKEGGYIRKIPLDPWGQPYLDLFYYGPDGESG